MRANAFKLHTQYLERTPTPFGHKVLHPPSGYAIQYAVVHENKFPQRWYLRNDMVKVMPLLYLNVISSNCRARTRTSIFAWPVLYFVEECMALKDVCCTSIAIVYSADYSVGDFTSGLHDWLCWCL